MCLMNNKKYVTSCTLKNFYSKFVIRDVSYVVYLYFIFYVYRLCLLLSNMYYKMM